MHPKQLAVGAQKRNILRDFPSSWSVRFRVSQVEGDMLGSSACYLIISVCWDPVFWCRMLSRRYVRRVAILRAVGSVCRNCSLHVCSCALLGKSWVDCPSSLRTTVMLLSVELWHFSAIEEEGSASKRARNWAMRYRGFCCNARMSLLCEDTFSLRSRKGFGSRVTAYIP